MNCQCHICEQIFDTNLEKYIRYEVCGHTCHTKCTSFIHRFTEKKYCEICKHNKFDNETIQNSENVKKRLGSIITIEVETDHVIDDYYQNAQTLSPITYENLLRNASPRGQQKLQSGFQCILDRVCTNPNHDKTSFNNDNCTCNIQKFYIKKDTNYCQDNVKIAIPVYPVPI